MNDRSTSSSVAYQRMRAPATRRIWCVPDGCGAVCASVTWLLVIYALFCSFTCVLIPTPSDAFRVLYTPVFVTLLALGLASHLRTMLTDPGTVPLGNANRENLMRAGLQPFTVVHKCEKCASIKPDRAHHCSVCKRCVRKMDHHCPWVNNCVGESNQKYFILFTMYIGASSWLCLIMIAHHLVICMPNNFHDCSYMFSGPTTTGLMIFLVIESLLFGLFTSGMFGDQLCSVAKAESAIDRLKRKRERDHRASSNGAAQPAGKSKLMHNLRSVCGSRPSINWLSPFSRVRIVQDDHETTYGDNDVEAAYMAEEQSTVNAV